MKTAIRTVWPAIMLMSTLPAIVLAADPADATAPVAGQEYHSPLADYQRWQYPSPGDWRAANDRVAEIGGWQAYAAEVWEASQQADAADDAPEPADHHGHH
ncbi:hypothetical protein [Halopseudomonas salegens]|uniref:Uncharacterized protein n=1 Tax=Halopseudomonas salegens TaxID=1434072 RepID=A0A1H2DYR8_9GAMM|nr:hypothetical protein [Halopseudomonas salegens]SDT87977.1 hypothetical protein SAMN05216210_0114 [Halopseudomonas salegens]